MTRATRATAPRRSASGRVGRLSHPIRVDGGDRPARRTEDGYAVADVLPRSRRKVTLKEAAERLAVTPDTLRQQIANGRLRATKHGRDWWVEPAEVARYAEQNSGRVGRRATKETKR
jgi:excisionase family DNA binding protein